MKTIIFAAALTVFSSSSFANKDIFPQDYTEYDQKNSELCVEIVRSLLKDPYSAKFRPFAKTIRSKDSDIFGKTGDEVYVVYVNSKNSFGAYTGEKMAFCLKPKGSSEMKFLFQN
jgi:hypothetical protein